MSEKEKLEKLEKLPLLPIRDPDLILFPHTYCEADVGRPFSIQAITQSKEKFNSRIIVVIQRDPNIDDPKASDLCSICVEAVIKSDKPVGQNKLTIILHGETRAKLCKVEKTQDSIYGYIEYKKQSNKKLTQEEIENAKYIRDMVLEKCRYISLKNIGNPKDQKELSEFTDVVVGQLKTKSSDKLKLLATFNLDTRVSYLVHYLENLEQTKTEPKRQGSNMPTELVDLLQRLTDAKIPKTENEIVMEEFTRLTKTPSTNSEYHVAFNYLTYISKLPWSITTKDNLNIENARSVLNEDHYGMKESKERILEYLSVRKLNKKLKGSILCLHGPCGTGKTSIGKSVARAMGRKFVRVSLGGVSDEAEIRGHRRTYIGAIAGRILENIKKVGTRNPVFMLDEVDKLSANHRGDPAAALLEVLDPEQNNSFTDNYLALPFDLSQVFFICTVNNLNTIAPALRDRLEIIDVPGYSLYDKLQIASNYLVPKQRKENGVDDRDITLSNNAISRIIEQYTNEAGVRTLERSCGTIMRKMAVLVASGKDCPQKIKVDNVPKYLGPPKMFNDKKVEKPEIGLSTGLAWSVNGGSILFVEATCTDGKGAVKLTGNLGKVIQESANAAHTFLRSNKDKFGIIKDISNLDVHLHLPAGAIPKDGPSAGIAISIAMLSAFLEKPVNNNFAMTGEITLRGRVLPIGGLREKILAAHRAGITNVIFPEQNKHDIDGLPEDVKNSMTFYKVSYFDEVIDLLLGQTETLSGPMINVERNNGKQEA